MKKFCKRKTGKRKPLHRGRAWPGHQIASGINEGAVRRNCVYAERFGSCVAIPNLAFALTRLFTKHFLSIKVSFIYCWRIERCEVRTRWIRHIYQGAVVRDYFAAGELKNNPGVLCRVIDSVWKKNRKMKGASQVKLLWNTNVG